MRKRKKQELTENIEKNKEIVFDISDLDYREMEAYKTLYSNIILLDDEIKVIAYTSYTSLEKTCDVVIDAAIAYAHLGKRVICVDANFHQSELNIYCNQIDIRGGLSRYLLADIPISEVVVKTNIRGVDAIIAGKKVINHYDVLTGKRFCELIMQLKMEYDYVFINTPPIGSMADALLIANQCDGVILVVSPKKVHYKELLRAKEQLDRKNHRTLGVILNEVAIKKYGKEYIKKYGWYFGEFK
jgi:capsular exopolysaccharide synthesis family protein